MKNNLMDINGNKIMDEACAIDTLLKRLDGQMTFFSHLIEDVEKNKEGMSKKIMHGRLEKQLNAIYALFLYELENIKESNDNIYEISEALDSE